MTEQEYIIVTNRVKISMAKTAVNEVLSGDNYGVSDDEKKALMQQLYKIESMLFAKSEEIIV